MEFPPISGSATSSKRKHSTEVLLEKGCIQVPVEEMMREYKQRFLYCLVLAMCIVKAYTYNRCGRGWNFHQYQDQPHLQKGNIITCD